MDKLELYIEKNVVFRKSPPGEGGFEEGDAPCRGLRRAEGVGIFIYNFNTFE